MKIVYVILVVAILILIWRLNHPGDLRLHRKYIGRFIKDAQGQGPTHVSLVKLPVDQTLAIGVPEERVWYHLDACFRDGEQRSALVQVFYPLEELQAERERMNRPGVEDPDLAPPSMSMASADFSAKLKEDPFKELTKEEKVVAAKSAQVAGEIELLRVLGNDGVLFPTLLAHDEKRLITFTNPIGTKRLDDRLHELETAERVVLLEGLMQDLAAFHGKKEDVDLAALLPGAGHTQQNMMEALYGSLLVWLHSEGADADFIQAVLEAAAPLFITAEIEPGLRLLDSSPRAFFVRGQRARRPNWAGVRRDVSALDVIELVCDPAVGLSAEQEMHLFSVYLQAVRPINGADRPTAEDMRRLAVYFRMGLIGHMAGYASAAAAKESDYMGIKYWSEDSLAAAAANLLLYLRADAELQALYELLGGELRLLAHQA